MPIQALYRAEKTIVATVKWTKPDSIDGYVRVYTSLAIGDILEAGLILKVGAYKHHPDRHVSFELCVEGFDGTKTMKLARIDWRDLKGGHSNNRKQCGGSERRSGETHIHSFEANWVEAERRMRRGNLPCAVTVSEDLQSFEQLRAYVGTVFNINNIDIVPPPNWVYDLFK